MTGIPVQDRTDTEGLIAAGAEAAREREIGDAGHPTAEELAASPVRLGVEHLDLFYGDHHALKDVSIDIRDRQITSFIGPSGCGKSTLLRCFNRMNDGIKDCRIEGSITLDGQDILGDYNTCRLRQRVGMVFQRPNPFPMSIYDNVAYGPRGLGIKDRATLDGLVEESLTRAALWDEVKDKLKQSGLGLSGGQQQRLCIAHERPRPGVDARDRAARRRTQEDLHARGGHAQYATGIAHLGLGGVLPAGRARGARAHRRAFQESARPAHG